jgi:hypothetical protein
MVLVRSLVRMPWLTLHQSRLLLQRVRRRVQPRVRRRAR